MLSTLEEAKARVSEIESLKDDDEAHALEDNLYHDFLRVVAMRAADRPPVTVLELMAREILTTEDIRFARWGA